MGLFDSLGNLSLGDVLQGAYQGALLANAYMDPAGQMQYVLPSIERAKKEQLLRQQQEYENQLNERRMALQEKQSALYEQQLNKPTEYDKRVARSDSIFNTIKNNPDLMNMYLNKDYNGLVDGLSAYHPRADAAGWVQGGVTTESGNVRYDDAGNVFATVTDKLTGRQTPEKIGEIPWQDSSDPDLKWKRMIGLVNKYNEYVDQNPDKADQMPGLLSDALGIKGPKAGQQAMDFMRNANGYVNNITKLAEAQGIDMSNPEQAKGVANQIDNYLTSMYDLVGLPPKEKEQFMKAFKMNYMYDHANAEDKKVIAQGGGGTFFERLFMSDASKKKIEEYDKMQQGGGAPPQGGAPPSAMGEPAGGAMPKTEETKAVPDALKRAAAKAGADPSTIHWDPKVGWVITDPNTGRVVKLQIGSAP